MSDSSPITVWHFSDPGCPWAYSSWPALAQLRWRFGEQLEWRLVTIGLSEDASGYEARGYKPGKLAAGHRKFQRRFGMPFATGAKPRLAGTSPGCRAVVAARLEDPELGYAAIRALALMQFTTTGLLDEPNDLRRALEGVEGLDAAAIVARIDDADVREAYEADRARSRQAEGTPTHVQGRHAESDGPVRYTAPSIVFERPDGRSLEVGGFQPFESYDTALANLDSSLERRQPPADAAEAVLGFRHGLTTADAAAVLRPSDLEDPDIEATYRGLIAAADEGRIVCEPHGGDAVWRAPRSGETTATVLPAASAQLA